MITESTPRGRWPTAEVVATDTWVSMGQQSTGRESIFVPFSVTR